AFDRVGVVAIDRVAHRSNGVFDLLFLIARDFVAQFLELFLALISQHVGVVLDLDGFLRLLVLFGVRFGFALHLFHFIPVQAAGTGDRDFLFSAGAEILGANIEDAVRVGIERHFDLRNTARSGWNSVEMENAELLVIARQWPLTLQHLDLYAWLIVAVSRKNL